MKRAGWKSCCAVVAFVLLSVGAHAQEEAANDPFGEGELSAFALQPAGERSLLEGPQPTAAESNRDFCKCVGDRNSRAVQKIERALNTELRGTGLDFTDVPLEEVATVLEDDYGIPIEIDTQALDEIGIGPDESITASLHGISLRSALRLMLGQIGLTYIIRDEVLMITTPEEAEQHLVVCVYDVRDLVAKPKHAPDFDPLIDAIVSSLSKDMWSENGGVAEIRPLQPGYLVVSQTQAVHDQVQGLIETLHDARRQWPEQPAAAREQSAAAVPAGDKVVTRSYFLQIPRESDSVAVAQQIRTLIMRSLPDASWDRRLEDGQAVVLTVLPDRIIVRHTPAVQQEVEALLADSGVAAPASASDQAYGGGGFGEGGFGGGGGGFGGGGFGGEGGGGGFFQPGRSEAE